MKLAKSALKHILIHLGLYYLLIKREIPSAKTIRRVADANEKLQDKLLGKYLDKRHNRKNKKRRWSR